MKKIFLLVIALFIFVPVSSAEEKFSVSHEKELGGVIIHCAINDFNSLGYEYGDSLNFNFSNGQKLEDIPYYNGYYSEIGSLLLLAYPDGKNVLLKKNLGSDIWGDLSLNENDFVLVSLNSKGKYKDIQEARNIQYSNDRSKYSSDEEFSNFRAVNIGKLKKNFLYRSASPCDITFNRAGYVDGLIKNAGIKCILDLADNEEKIKKFISKSDFASPYFLDLYENKNVILCGMSANFYSETFRKKLISSLNAMSAHEGPFLINCLEGKDRTGFVCILISMLAGASYEEILNDYMISFANYYGITSESDNKKYNTIITQLFTPMIKEIIQDENVDAKNADLVSYAEKFLLASGMNEAELNNFKSCILE